MILVLHKRCFEKKVWTISSVYNVKELRNKQIKMGYHILDYLGLSGTICDYLELSRTISSIRGQGEAGENNSLLFETFCQAQLQLQIQLS